MNILVKFQSGVGMLITVNTGMLSYRHTRYLDRSLFIIVSQEIIYSKIVCQYHAGPCMYLRYNSVIKIILVRQNITYETLSTNIFASMCSYLFVYISWTKTYIKIHINASYTYSRSKGWYTVRNRLSKEAVPANREAEDCEQTPEQMHVGMRECDLRRLRVTAMSCVTRNLVTVMCYT